MSADWPIVQLGHYCSKIGSGATPRGGASVYLDEGEIYLIRSQNIYNDGFKPNGLVYISEESAGRLKNVIVEKNDILLNITGDSVARVCLAKDEYLPARVNQHVAIIRPDPKEFDARYLRYLLASSTMQSLLLSIAAVGATRNALTKSMIETLDVAKPPIETQIEIADNLQSFDDKIELNRQTNQTLEHIAQALFKSWFVDFEPTRAKQQARASIAAGKLPNSEKPLPKGFNQQDEEQLVERAAMTAISGKSLTELDQLSPEQQNQLKTTAALFPDALVDSELGEMPEGWCVGCIGDIASAKGGYAFKGKSFVEKGCPVVKIKNITGDGRVDLNGAVCITDAQAKSSERFKLEDGNLLMAMTGATVGKIGFVVTEGKPVYLNQRVAKFESEKFGEKISWFLFCCFERDSIFEAVVGAASGSAQPNISSSGIESTSLILPADKLIDLFCNKVDSLFNKWLSTINENIVLAESRDTLLPKLLSGELEINTAS